MNTRAIEASRAARTGALLVEAAERGTLLASGPDRTSWLNGLLTCALDELRPGVGRFGLALTKQGKILSDVDVVGGSEQIYMGVAPGRAQALCEELDRYLIMEEAEIANGSERFGWIMLHGPRAAELGVQAARLHGAQAAVIDWTGLGGAALVGALTEREALLAELVRLGGETLCVATPEQWRALRIERLLPEYGEDYDERDNPHEASLDQRAVSWTKGCYLGQEVVCMQDMRGKVKRRLAALALDEGADVPLRGVAVQAAESGQAVGEVTSAAFSMVLEKPVALARLQGDFADACAPIRVAGRAAHVLEAAV